jgi:hypothetical protein
MSCEIVLYNFFTIDASVQSMSRSLSAGIETNIEKPDY